MAFTFLTLELLLEIMYHTRKQIIENQQKYREQIVDSLKKEFSLMKKELRLIKTKDQEVIQEKKKMLDRAKKINITKEINNYFISWKNIYPKFYAFWDETNQQVLKLKYEDK